MPYSVLFAGLLLASAAMLALPDNPAFAASSTRSVKNSNHVRAYPQPRRRAHVVVRRGDGAWWHPPYHYPPPPRTAPGPFIEPPSPTASPELELY